MTFIPPFDFLNLIIFFLGTIWFFRLRDQKTGTIYLLVSYLLVVIQYGIFFMPKPDWLFLNIIPMFLSLYLALIVSVFIVLWRKILQLGILTILFQIIVIISIVRFLLFHARFSVIADLKLYTVCYFAAELILYGIKNILKKRKAVA